MKKPIVLCLSFFLLLVWAVVPAFSWGSATHAFIAGKIGKFFPLMNANERYGIMAADIFNYVLSTYGDPTIKAYTHGIIQTGDDSFMKVWQLAKWWGYEKSLGFGYVAHNELWGCDFTAHIQARTTGQAEGYVITKARALMPYLRAALPPELNPYVTDDVLLELCHNLVESAGDIILTRADRQIGEKIVSCAILRSNDFPGLVARAMGPSWKDAVFAAEKEFRKTMILYGAALTQGEEAAIKALSEQMAQIGVEFIKMATGGLVVLPLDQAKQLAEFGIRTAISLCENDYMTEVNATTRFVKANLAAHGVRY
jgi:hypothetical protein